MLPLREAIIDLEETPDAEAEIKFPLKAGILVHGIESYLFDAEVYLDLQIDYKKTGGFLSRTYFITVSGKCSNIALLLRDMIRQGA